MTVIVFPYHSFYISGSVETVLLFAMLFVFLIALVMLYILTLKIIEATVKRQRGFFFFCCFLNTVVMTLIENNDYYRVKCADFCVVFCPCTFGVYYQTSRFVR